MASREVCAELHTHTVARASLSHQHKQMYIRGSQEKNFSGLGVVPGGLKPLAAIQTAFSEARQRKGDIAWVLVPLPVTEVHAGSQALG